MKKQLFAIGMVLLVAGCAKQPDYECKFTLNGETQLTLNFINVDKPESFAFFYDQSFPAEQYQKIFSVESDTTFEYVLPLNHPAQATCVNRCFSFYMFLVQNEPLTVTVDLANDTLAYEGFTQSICSFLNATTFYNEYESDQSYFSKIDADFAFKQKQLDSAYAAGQLPKWFFDLKTDDLYFENNVLFKYPTALQLNLFDSLIKSTPLRESKYFWLYNYVGFLCMYNDPEFVPSYDKAFPDSIYYQYVQNNIDKVKPKLPENIASFFIASRLSNYLNLLRRAETLAEYDAKNEYLNKLFAKYSNLITDTTLRDYITNEQENIQNDLISRKSLKPGDKAPNFYLKSLNGKSVSLTDYKGKLVLLNFWDTFCSVCIGPAIPLKNALVEKYGKYGFELVNICLNDAPETVQKIVKERNALGEQLICKGNWADNLRGSYTIRARPQYTLIDRDGLIIKDRLWIDSAAYYIEKSLGK